LAIAFLVDAAGGCMLGPASIFDRRGLLYASPGAHDLKKEEQVLYQTNNINVEELPVLPIVHFLETLKM
jgi:hypothetical protein